MGTHFGRVEVRKKKSTNDRELKPYWNNPNIAIVYEMDLNGVKLTPGSMIKISGDRRNNYRFTRLVRDEETNKEWVDCLNMTLGGFYSFYVDRIQAPVVKRSRAKKNV